jgi:hypothetical protein
MEALRGFYFFEVYYESIKRFVQQKKVEEKHFVLFGKQVSLPKALFLITCFFMFPNRGEAHFPFLHNVVKCP